METTHRSTAWWRASALFIASTIASAAGCGHDNSATVDVIDDAADSDAATDTDTGSSVCADECSAVGQRECSGEGFRICDVQGACLGWSTVTPCMAGASCSAGFCALDCASVADPCADEGAARCGAGGRQVCVETAGCLGWSPAEACAAGTACSDGECVAACSGQACTVANAKKCHPTDADVVQTCGDFDGDGCLEWGADVSCDGGQVCSTGGFCALSCADECSTVGATKCEGDSVVSCDEHDGDGCLEWGGASPCSSGFCTSGFCASQCNDECDVLGQTTCDGNGTKQCALNADGCLAWGTVQACTGATTCSGGVCSVDCQNECPVVGQTTCLGGGVATCGNVDADSCLEWSTPLACGVGESCSAGACSVDCVDECTVIGTKECDAGGLAVRVCGQHDADGCLEWAIQSQCGADETCSGGACSVVCADECVAGAHRCQAGSTTRIESCGNTDADPCTEWSEIEDCASSGEVCADGACAASCVDDCDTAGASSCEAGVESVCGNFDADSCLDLGSPVFCEAFETCSDGACTAAAAPADLVISEVLYDAPGADTDVFVELFGPPGTSLAGFSLVGINGNGGADYHPIALAGDVPADGYFVIAHPSAEAWISNHADQTSSDVDFQNGPDNIVLRFGDTVVDAVGYGSFDGGDVFAGETAPCEDPSSGWSIARDEDATDTDDNSVDFTANATATPGAPPLVVAANMPPTAVLTCPTDATAGAAVSLSAASSSDSDGTIVSYAFATGAGNIYSGSSATTDATFAAPGAVLVTLTVTDDDGASTSDTCTITVAAPTTGGGDPPTASFLAIANGYDVQVDASASRDDTTPRDALEVRWDFDGDGTFDTAWSTDKDAIHSYIGVGNSESRTIHLEVRDADGLVSSATRTVVVGLDAFPAPVSGTITLDTTWSGTKLLTNDLRVAPGATLTIEPGTRILVSKPASGAHHIEIDGLIHVNGTAAEPVVFTPYGVGAKVRGAWTGLILTSSGSNTGSNVISHAIIEYAYRGIRTASSHEYTVADTTFRLSTRGIEHNAGTVNYTRVRALDNLIGMRIGYVGGYGGTRIANISQSAFDHNDNYGIWMPSDDYTNNVSITTSQTNYNGIAGISANVGDLTAIHVLVRGNGQTGISKTSDIGGDIESDGDLSLQHVLVEDNGGHGIWSMSSAISVTDSVVRNNAGVGVVMMSSWSATLERNDLFGNAIDVGYERLTDVMTVATTLAEVATVEDTYTAPNNAPILVTGYRYTIHPDAVSCQGADRPYVELFKNGETSDFQDFSYTYTGGSRWWDWDGITSLRAKHVDGSTICSASFEMFEIVYEKIGAPSQVLARSTDNVSGNYWGTSNPAEIEARAVFWAERPALDNEALAPNPGAGTQVEIVY